MTVAPWLGPSPIPEQQKQLTGDSQLCLAQEGLVTVAPGMQGNAGLSSNSMFVHELQPALNMRHLAEQ